MSIRVMSMVWESFPGGGSGLLTLLALADWSDDNGHCWPSVSAIAKKIRLSRSQTQRVVHSLIDDGFVVVTGNETGGAPGATRQYRIVLKRCTGRTHATGSSHAQDGSHGSSETGRIHATQTINEPSMNHQVPTSSGAVVPSVISKSPDPIFGGCLTFLVGKGCSSKRTRSFLGKMRKIHGDKSVMQAIERAERNDISAPIPWIKKVLESQATQPQKSRHMDLSNIDYTAGVNDDGTF